MPFTFERADPTVQDAFRRLAAEQIDLSLSEVGEDGAAQMAEAVHSARKRCKRLRALLRLVRFSFAAFKDENGAVRDAAANLSPLRDADVMPATFDKVREVLARQMEPKAVQRLRQALARRTRRRKAEIDAPAAMARFSEAMREVRRRVPEWRLQGDGFAAIDKGFATVYRRGRHDRRLCGAEPTAEAFHDWRKQVKTLYYHLCLLRDVAPHMLEGQRKLAHLLGEALGEHHDIAVFFAVLGSEPDALGKADGEQALRDALQERQDALGTVAMRLGDELFGERPKHLEERLGRYWFNWRHLGGEAHGPRDRAQVPGA